MTISIIIEGPFTPLPPDWAWRWVVRHESLDGLVLDDPLVGWTQTLDQALLATGRVAAKESA